MVKDGSSFGGVVLEVGILYVLAPAGFLVYTSFKKFNQVPISFIFVRSTLRRKPQDKPIKRFKVIKEKLMINHKPSLKIHNEIVNKIKVQLTDKNK